MSDYLGAQITIGSCISRALAPRLAKLIAQADLLLDWEEPFNPQSPEELLAARRTIDGEWVLQLTSNDAPYGEFLDLEAFLVKHEIAFDRQSDAGHGHDAALVVYRPGSKPVHFLATSPGEAAVPIQPVWQLEDGLRALLRTVGRAPRRQIISELQDLLASAREFVPARPTALRTFEIGKTVGLRKSA